MKKNLWMWATILLSCGLALTSCGDAAVQKKVSGVLEEPVVVDMPEQVEKAYAATTKVHTFDILNDTLHNISVAGIGELDGGASTEGFGVMVTKNATSTSFHGIRNTRQPMAAYDADANCLWLTSCVMEGTGTHVEQLYKMQFGTADDSARVVMAIEPYQMQQTLIEHLTYTVAGEEVTFYVDGTPIATAKNTVTDMGGFDAEQPVWVGEQISYDLSGAQPRVCFVPGVKYTTGLVLTYDDMPTLSAQLTVNDNGGYTVGDLKIKK